MSRQPRASTVVPGLPHHIVLRGNNRRRLFSYPRDRLELLRLVTRASRRTDVPVHGLSLVTNHGHLIATPPSVDALSSFVQGFAQEYAWRRNRKRDGSGKLFEERFFAKPITSDDQLAATTVYVDLNGLRAGLSTSPEGHRWCTYRLHASGHDELLPDDLWTPSAWWLALGRDDRERGAHYQAIAGATVTSPVPQRLEAMERESLSPLDDRRPDGTRVAEPDAPPYGFGEIAAGDE